MEWKEIATPAVYIKPIINYHELIAFLTKYVSESSVPNVLIITNQMTTLSDQTTNSFHFFGSTENIGVQNSFVNRYIIREFIFTTS